MKKAWLLAIVLSCSNGEPVGPVSDADTILPDADATPEASFGDIGNISILQPEEGVVSGVITISVAIERPENLLGMEIFLGTQKIAYLETAPFTAEADTTVVPDGETEIIVYAKDKRGNLFEKHRPITVNNNPPTLEILIPKTLPAVVVESEDGKFSLTIGARVADGNGLAIVEITYGEEILLSLAEPQENIEVELDLTPIALAQNIWPRPPIDIALRARDKYGKEAFAQLQVLFTKEIWSLDFSFMASVYPSLNQVAFGPNEEVLLQIGRNSWVSGLIYAVDLQGRIAWQSPEEAQDQAIVRGSSVWFRTMDKVYKGSFSQEPLVVDKIGADSYYQSPPIEHEGRIFVTGFITSTSEGFIKAFDDEGSLAFDRKYSAYFDTQPYPVQGALLLAASEGQSPTERSSTLKKISKDSGLVLGSISMPPDHYIVWILRASLQRAILFVNKNNFGAPPDSLLASVNLDMMKLDWMYNIGSDSLAFGPYVYEDVQSGNVFFFVRSVDSPNGSLYLKMLDSTGSPVTLFTDEGMQGFYGYKEEWGCFLLTSFSQGSEEPLTVFCLSKAGEKLFMKKFDGFDATTLGDTSLEDLIVLVLKGPNNADHLAVLDKGGEVKGLWNTGLSQVTGLYVTNSNMAIVAGQEPERLQIKAINLYSGMEKWVYSVEGADCVAPIQIAASPTQPTILLGYLLGKVVSEDPFEVKEYTLFIKKVRL